MGRRVIVLPEHGPVTVSEDEEGRPTLIVETQPMPVPVVRAVEDNFPPRDAENILSVIADVQLEAVFRNLIRGE